MKSASSANARFSQVPRADIPRSSFNRSSTWKGTMQSGLIVPILVDHVLPGDTFNHKSTLFGRMATPIYPVMDNMKLQTFFFAVPYRLIFDNFQRMMGEQDNPTDSTDYIFPTSTAPSGGYDFDTLQDYMGLTPKIANMTHNTLPLRAYNLIWNEFFRDQNLQDSVVVDKGDGPDNPADYVLLRRGKRHDYFTSALPWPQKGPAVEIPLGNSAPIFANVAAGTPVDDSYLRINDSNGAMSSMVIDSNVVEIGNTASSGTPLQADLSNATAATINQLREAFQIQKMYERDARGGTRYTSIIRSHFGITSPDARLQRPEFLGGGTSHININPVQQTAEGSETTVGTLGALGTVSATNNGFTKSFTEHCVIIGLAQISADLTYQQGLDRFWSKSDRFDTYFPALAHLGEQEVFNKEIYVQGTDADEEIFGYQERYAEYRYRPSTIHGQFRSSHPTSLDAWHLSQEFANLPVLGPDFIQDDPPIDRIIATPEEPQFIMDIFHKTIAARPMPLYGVPGNIDRF